jgi:hypothetical protein
MGAIGGWAEPDIAPANNRIEAPNTADGFKAALVDL